MSYNKFRRIAILAAVVALVLAGTAQAALITSLVGDKDGFGLGGGVPSVPGPADGTWSSWGGGFPDDNRGGGDPAFTDIWEFEQNAGGPLSSPVSWTHSYGLVGTPISATLTINEAGMSDARGPWDISVNSTSIGQIGVFPGADSQTFKILNFAVPTALLTGTDTVTLTYMDTVGEGFAINFAELNVETVPEPATVTLFALGVLGIAVGRRRYRGNSN